MVFVRLQFLGISIPDLCPADGVEPVDGVLPDLGFVEGCCLPADPPQSKPGAAGACREKSAWIFSSSLDAKVALEPPLAQLTARLVGLRVGPLAQTPGPWHGVRSAGGRRRSCPGGASQGIEIGQVVQPQSWFFGHKLKGEVGGSKNSFVVGHQNMCERECPGRIVGSQSA